MSFRTGRALLPAIIAAALGASVLQPAGAAAPQCDSRNPQIGTLTVSEGGSVDVYRRGARQTLVSGDILCLNDKPQRSEKAGQVRDNSGNVTKFAAKTVPAIPARDSAIIAWFKAFRSSDTMREIWGSMSPDTDHDFPLAGLRAGTETLSPGHLNLRIPVTPGLQPRTARLLRDGAPSGDFRVASGAEWIDLGDAAKKAGRYSLSIEPGGYGAAFVVQQTKKKQDARFARLPAIERALAAACLQPYTDALEALQVLRAEKALQRELVLPLLWQKPTEELTCATPPA